MLIYFFLGALLGMLVGEVLCVAYIRHEITADIGPKLRRLQAQLDILESTMNLAVMTRYSELSGRPPS